MLPVTFRDVVVPTDCRADHKIIEPDLDPLSSSLDCADLSLRRRPAETGREPTGFSDCIGHNIRLFVSEAETDR